MDSVIRDAIREIETVVHHRGPIELQALRVSTLAERHGLSRFQFQRRFKAITGMTVRDYINHAILGQVAERLLYTDEPIHRRRQRLRQPASDDAGLQAPLRFSTLDIAR